ncbi:MAG: hypothetical protein ABR964_05710 [Tepidisphaeraceae bacterium]|jgi:hypothetical protein
MPDWVAFLAERTFKSPHDAPIRTSRRGACVVGPLLLYVLIALGMLWPYRAAKFRPAGDLVWVMGGIVDAGKALREGQFPVRVAPSLNDGLRYPLFQYYGNFPYTAAGSLCALLGLDPYSAWKIVSLVILVAAGIFTQRLAYCLWRHYAASVVAGAIFLCAPYLMTDLNARGAYAEMVAFGLLPVAYYFTLRALASPPWRYIALCAASWALIVLAHNITYLYAVLFAVPFFLPYVLTRRFAGRMVRLTLASALHALLVLWYIVPQMRTLDALGVERALFNPFERISLTPLSILLAPTLTNTPEGQTTPHLGLQVGWPILVGVLLALAGLFFRRRGGAPRRAATIRLILLFLLAFVLAWSPVNFWKYLPKVFWYIQLPYRVLMFVVLFGSVVCAGGLAAFFSRRLPGPLILLLLGLIGLAVSSYVPGRRALDPNVIRIQMATPDMPSVVDQYLPAPDALAATNLSAASPDNKSWPDRLVQINSSPSTTGLRSAAPMRQEIRRGGSFGFWYAGQTPVLLEMPVLYYPRVLEVRDNGRPVAYGNAGRFVALPLQPGAHQISVRFIGVHWANVLGALAWGGLAIGASLLAVRRLATSFHWLRQFPATTFAAPFSVGTAVLGFVTLVGAALIGMNHPIDWLMNRSPHLKLTASSMADPTTGPDMAFDDDPDTAWIAGDPYSAVLKAALPRPAMLRQIELRPRVTTLYEGWHRVRVVLLSRGETVYSKDVDFPDAAHQWWEVIAIPSITTDEVDLYFSDAVTERRDGRHVSVEAVRPGYAEIRFVWE